MTALSAAEQPVSPLLWKIVQLSRQLIITAAIDILNTYGLGDMTMRRLAKQLSVAPGALYWHFPSKQALITDLGRHILEPVLGDFIHHPDPYRAAAADAEPEEAPTPITSEPLAALGIPTPVTSHEAPADPLQLSLALRTVLMGYRDGAELVLASLSDRQLRNDIEDAFEASLKDSCSDPLRRRCGAATLVHFAMGSISHEQGVTQLAHATTPTPNNAGSPADMQVSDEKTFAENYSFGVGMILAGISAA